MPPESEAAPKGLVTLPTGTVTFLFSDVEGSTQRWEHHRDAMKAAVARHEQLMSTAIKQHGGYVFKTIGDAFCAAFPTAPDAAGAALDAQLALAKEDFASVDGLRVRMGLHTGHAEERNADYFGPTVNRVARLMSIGHGGQVLLSGSTRELARSDLPAGATLLDLGTHRLKDLTEPEQVWQLTIAGLPVEFPPLKSLDTLPNNLPIQRTTLVGREQDVAVVKELVGNHRLLTLFGAGGVGKTRLALQVGAELLDQYPDGVWFVDFAPITDPELVSSVIAKVLGMSQQEGRRVDESIAPWLKRKKLLLILDNCEHVLEIVAKITDLILTTAPDVKMLTTSRQALGIGGEVVHRLPSLSIPDKTNGLRSHDALHYGAILMFVDRAKAADTRFALSNENAPIVAEICRRLDGIPLAIELAAARVKVLSIHNLAHRLDERFKILTGGSRTALPRQKTLGALIDWSYDLLTPHEQKLFNRLGIFAGSFSLDAATEVCSGEAIDETDILDLLSSLTDKSLVVADTCAEQERYRLLESTRAYALEKLALARERDRVTRRHGEYFRDQAQAADIRYGDGSTRAWLEDVELDLDNYRAALKWAFTDGHEVELGAAVAGALERLWFAGGLIVEGRYWIARAQTCLDESEQPRVAARLWRALSLLSDGKRGHDCAERALVLYQSIGDKDGAAKALAELGYGLYQMGRLEESNETLTRALVALRECGDKRGMAACLTQQATIYPALGDLAAGRELCTQALAAFKALGDESGTALVLGTLAELEFSDGRVEEALRLADEALALHIRAKNTETLAVGYVNSAAYRIALGDVNGAREAARQGLHWSRQAQYAFGVAIALQHLALLGALCGHAQRAAQLMGYVNAKYQELGMQRESTEKWGYDKLMDSLRKHLSDAEIEKLAAEGAAWSEDQVVEEALKV
jgi:predicted ATPase/class 3 adenylate cyclase